MSTWQFVAGKEGRPSDVRRPWPTAPVESGRVAWLLVLAAISQFILNAFQNVWTARVMFWLRRHLRTRMLEPRDPYLYVFLTVFALGVLTATLALTPWFPGR